MRLLLAVCASLVSASAVLAADTDVAAEGEKAKAIASVPPGVVDGAAARQLVAAGVKVVDVRTPAEFAAGHVPGAVNIPYDEMERRYGELGPKSTPLLVYCRTGHRSGIAIKTLREHGFETIYDLKAYDRWVQSGTSQAQQ